MKLDAHAHARPDEKIATPSGFEAPQARRHKRRIREQRRGAGAIRDARLADFSTDANQKFQDDDRVTMRAGRIRHHSRIPGARRNERWR